MDLEFNVVNQTIKRLDTLHPVQGSKEYLYCHFNFTSDWQDTNKVAFFYNNEEEVATKVELIDDKCLVPSDLIKAPLLRIYLYGYGTNSQVKISTGTAPVIIGKAKSDLGENPNIKYIDSESLDVKQDGERVNIEIPNEYVKSFTTNYSDENASIMAYGSNNKLLGNIDLKGALSYYKPIILKEAENYSTEYTNNYVTNYTYSKEQINQKNIEQDNEIKIKANKEWVNNFSLNFNSTNGYVTLLNGDGEQISYIDLPTELIPVSGYYDNATNEIVIELSNGKDFRIPATALIDDYTGGDTPTIKVDVSNENEITAYVKNGSITKDKFESSILQVFNDFEIVVENENIRQENEQTRQANESKRVANENTRVANENIRISNETKREEDFADMQVTMADSLNGMIADFHDITTYMKELI